MSFRPQGGTSEADFVAARFVEARLAAVALNEFPGPLPGDMEAGYRCQDAAIHRWPAPVVGWKVGYIAQERREPLGDERLLGPIFADRLHLASAEVSEVPVIAGGFAAVEAEFVFRLAFDAPADRFAWSTRQAAGLVAEMYIGVEIAGSPLASINALGPVVVVSDFGNNSGLLLGSRIADWERHALNTLTCTTHIDGILVGIGGATSLPGGPLAALAFALARNARRGRPLRAGDLITTGAATGIHDIVAGQHAVVDFGVHGQIRCRAIAARAASDGVTAMRDGSC